MWTKQALRLVIETGRSGAVTQVSVMRSPALELIPELLEDGSMSKPFDQPAFHAGIR